MAVTFAVGAVTGTVLTFEFGLLWPRFMGQWGEAFGVPFAFEGLFFFTEAIFVAIYIFGWRRLKPWTHFWTGVPIVARRDLRQRVGGRRQRLDERAVGVHAELPPGNVVDVDPLRVIFNDAMPLQAAHMVVAAYLVGGFLIASVYAVGHAARTHGPLPPARLRHRVHGRGDRHADPDGRRRLAGPLGVQQPAGQVRRDRAGARPRAATSPRRCSASSTPTARSAAASRSRGWPRGCPTRARARSRSCRASTRCRQTSDRPSVRSTSSISPGTSWSAWERCCSCCRCGTAVSWIFRRRMPTSKWFLRAAAASGVLAVISHGGRLGRDRGRPPAVDRLRTS